MNYSKDIMLIHGTDFEIRILPQWKIIEKSKKAELSLMKTLYFSNNMSYANVAKYY